MIKTPPVVRIKLSVPVSSKKNKQAIPLAPGVRALSAPGGAPMLPIASLNVEIRRRIVDRRLGFLIKLDVAAGACNDVGQVTMNRREMAH